MCTKAAAPAPSLAREPKSGFSTKNGSLVSGAAFAMKPPSFAYHDPRSVEEAVALLGSLENAKVLAGGQSLMPMLNMRFVLPDHVIDINNVPGLSSIEAQSDALIIGAMTRQRELEFSSVIAEHCPILREALVQVGHRQTRNRGTIGGSLCHLDPAAELPTLCLAMDAEVEAVGAQGARVIPFAEFPLAYMTPGIGPDELVTRIRLPLWPKMHGFAFEEFARRHGDFAIASAAVLLTLDSAGAIDRIAVAIGGVAPTPLRMDAIEALLKGVKPTPEAMKAAVAPCKEIDALGDVHAPASYRQHLAGVMVRRALTRAVARAKGENA
jgi:carbon-monoxide dehydrogenase medium subunit